ncbi:MAG: hypothetical protein KDA80_07805 [Planctomycetaceae bacterium]|nr:hypothetical protein [Planctomycetaceae bacterium]
MRLFTIFSHVYFPREVVLPLVSRLSASDSRGVSPYVRSSRRELAALTGRPFRHNGLRGERAPSALQSV